MTEEEIAAKARAIVEPILRRKIMEPQADGRAHVRYESGLPPIIVATPTGPLTIAVSGYDDHTVTYSISGLDAEMAKELTDEILALGERGAAP